MKLTFTEKVMFSQILPTEGNFESLILIRDIKSKTEVTQEELKTHNVKSTDDNQIYWEKPDVEYDIDFTEAETNRVKDIMKKLSEEEKLTNQLLSLYEKFNK